MSRKKQEEGTKYVLAEGEVTGHAHRLESKADIEIGGEMGRKEFHAPTGVTITHEEHGPITLRPGKYATGIVQEFDPLAEELRDVAD